jgi:DNA-binding NarL/FixJ family response regulator
MVLREAPGGAQQAATNSADTDRRLSLLIVSEVRFLREALAELLRRDPSIAVTGLCADIDEAIEGSVACQPDLVLLDAGFQNGPAAVRRLREVTPGARIVALAVAETTENIIAWSQAGMTGYVPQTTALADLVGTLVSINRGDQICSARIVSGLLRHVGRSARSEQIESSPARAPRLTKREREISLLIGAGLSNKEIARRLDIGLATTKSHVHNLLAKMNAQSRGQAAARLDRSGGNMAGPI